MKKYIPGIALFITLCLIPARSSMDNHPRESANLFPLNEVDRKWIETTLSQMSIKEKCAQMIISAASSNDTSFDSDDYKRLEKLVKDFSVGGLIFFQGSLYNQVLVTNRLQSIAKVPLIISADYERGPGMRIKDIEQFPHNMALGAAGDPYLTYLMGKYTAVTSRAIGVHMNYAPLLDINNDYRNPIINIRAYSDDPNIISWHGNAFIKGMHEGGMITTAKHFPGHGATDLDSHEELPLIKLTEREFDHGDIIPFKEAISSGVKSIMVGHLQVPAFDNREGMPATFSSYIIEDYLKKKLNFKGLVITDAMNMKAVADSFDYQEAAKYAVLAGNDFVLFPPDDSLAIEGIYNGVLDGTLSEERINESVLKILSAKKWLNLDLFNQVDYELSSSFARSPDLNRLTLEIAEKSTTLLKDENNLIPINPSEYYHTASITLRGTIDRRSLNEEKVFERLIKDNFDYVQQFRLNVESRKRDYRRALNSAKKADLILLNLYLTSSTSEDYDFIDSTQKEFIQDIIKLNIPLVLSNFGNPYLLLEFKNTPSYLCSYSWTDVAQRAMFNSITGRNEITGKLPISIPETEFSIGFGQHRNIESIFIPDSSADSNYNFSNIDSLVRDAIKDSVFPGALILIGHRKRIIYNKPFGRFTYDSKSTIMSREAMFDLASVTKVTATTSAAMLLYDTGLLDLDQKVSNILPDFKGNGKEQITIRHLLTHNSGLPAFKLYYRMFNSREEIVKDIMKTELLFEPGTDYTYSDLGMITMQLVIERLTGQPIDLFLKENLFEKLGMSNTMYNPPPEKWYYCVPTEVDKYWRYITVKGRVHDENAFVFGGVAGHAGLFSTTTDLAKLMFLYINNGYSKGETIFKPTTIELFTTIQTKFGDRGLGWGIKSVDGYSSAGSKFSSASFGHTGFTGTSIWVDKDRGVFVILLTNRVHPTRNNTKIRGFRPILHDAVIDAISYK